ncbi:MAG: AsmA family protein [Rhodospirillales bacterium]|jgi:uncharacterized protein involved in outer membrane biogenesis
MTADPRSQTRFRKPLIALGAVTLLLLAAGFILPIFFKADRFRPEIESRMTEALGHPVVVETGIEFRLLPSPALTVRGLKIKAPPGATTPDLVDLRKARVEISFLKLVQGRIAFQAILLDGLVLTLETLADGSPSWKPKTGPAAAPPAGDAKEEKSAGDNSKAQALGVEVNHLLLSNAAVVIKDARTGAETRIEGLGFDAEAGSLMGPYRFTGQARLLGQPVLLDGGLEELRRDRASPLTVELAMPDAGFKARYGGILSLLSGGYAARGKLIVEAPSLEGLVRSLGLAKGLAPDPVRIESTLTASADTISLDETRIELAGGKGFGKLKLVLGGESRIEARLDMDQIDLDRLTPRQTAAAQPAAKGEASAPVMPVLAPAPPPPEAVSKPAQLPNNVSALVDLRIGRVGWNGQSIDQVRIDAALNSGELTVSQASVQLPGGGEAAFFGFVNNVPKGMKFEGTLEAQTPKLRALLAWLGSEPKAMAAHRLQNFRLRANVQGTSQEVRLTNLDAVLDESRLLGAAILKPGPRPALGLALDLNRLDLDSYLTAPTPAQKPQAEAGTDFGAAPVAKAAMPAAPAKPQASPLAMLSGFDANLRLTANNVVWKKTAMNRILIDGSLQNGALSFKEAGVGDLAGSSLGLKGVIDGLNKGVPEFKKLSLDIASRQPAILAGLLGLSASNLDEIGPFSARLSLDGGLEGMDILALLNAQGAETRLDGKLQNLLSAAPRFSGRAVIRHPNAAQLLKQGGNWGPLEAVSLLEADPSKIDLKDLTLNLGKGKIEGAVSALLSGARPQITAKLSGGEIDLDAYLPKKQAQLGRHGTPLGSGLGLQLAALASGSARWSNAPIDLAGLKSIDAKADLSLAGLRVSGIRLAKPVTLLDLKDGVLTVPKLTAHLWGGTLDGSARLFASSGLQMEGKATLTGADLKLTLAELAGLNQAAGKYDAQVRMTATGKSQAELVARLNGDGGFAAKDGVVEGIDLPAINRQLSNINNVAALAGLAAAVQGGGKTAFSQMSASFKAVNGVVTSNDIKLAADGGTGSGTMQADLPQWTQDARLSFKLTGIGNGPALGMRLQGPLDAPRKFIELDDLQRWAVEKGLTKGLKGKGLDGILGGGSSQPTPATPADPSAPPEKTSKKLRNILKGL